MEWRWAVELVTGSSVAQAIFVLALVAVSGLALGSLKVRGVGLGIAGVLFTGLIFGHFGVELDERVAAFAREFGLILFVYTIGMQVGPGFMGSLKKEGAPLNMLAAGVVLMGAVLAWAAHRFAGVDAAAVAGLFSGATTNTPSLGAAQEALAGLPGVTSAAARQPGLAYAVAYPFGVVGIIVAMMVLRVAFRLRVGDAEAAFLAERSKRNPGMSSLNLRVTNPNIEGLELSGVPAATGTGIVVSRVSHGGVVGVANDRTILHIGDIVLAVGTREKLRALQVVLGEPSEVDLSVGGGPVEVRRVMVTRKSAIGRTLADLGFEAMHGVRFTRLARSEVELPDPLGRRLQGGDAVTVVGEKSSLDAVAKALGNSLRHFDHPHVIPFFAGIALGIFVGSIPVFFPGMPAPVRLGLAGGPLLAAILLSSLGRVGPMVWFMPSNANYLLREIGIVLFLSVVGLKSGGRFVETLVAGEGVLWLACGAVITLVPLLVVGAIAVGVLRINYLSAVGVLAGSMTDPPALAFANSLTSTAAPALSYAAVYPLTMVLRVLAAQVLVLLLV
jgi:putative transport protein